MRSFLLKMLSPSSDVSSKRFITFSSFVLLSIGFLVELFSDFKAPAYIYNTLEYIVIAGLGFTASEAFATYVSSKTGKAKENDENN